MPYELYTRFFIGLYDTVVQPLAFLVFGGVSSLHRAALTSCYYFIFFFGGAGCFGTTSAVRLRKLFYERGPHDTYIFAHLAAELFSALGWCLGVLSDRALSFFAFYGLFFFSTLSGGFFVDSRASSGLTSLVSSIIVFFSRHGRAHPVDTGMYPTSTLVGGY